MLNKTNTVKFTPPKETIIDYKEFRGGWNNLFQETELRSNELAQADNLMLVGSGIPTKRWGSQNYFSAGATGTSRGLFWAKSANATSEVLSMTDWGYLTRKSGASYEQLTGASWVSGYNFDSTQLNDNIYIVSQAREMVRYNFTNLTSFVTLLPPTGVALTNISLATGTSTWSWRISATSRVGETLGSTAISFYSLPQQLNSTLVRVQWTPTSAASGILTGYQIYRGAPGDEVWVGSVDDQTNKFDDYGTVGSILRQPPTANTTGGPIAKIVIRYQDRLILGGVDGAPTKVMISGRVPNHERFDWAGGGGYVLVDPDTGDNITALAVHQGRIIVLKENSVWQVTLSNTTMGNYSILEPSYQLITASQGCSSHRSVCPVDNDLFFLGRKGVYILGYEPNITGDVLRTNELSAKIRPFFSTLSKYDLENAAAIYFDYKYIIAFPNAKKCIMFDKERIAWMGPWSTKFGINKFIRYIDDNGTEHLLAADSTDTFVSEFSDSLSDDKGTAFGTVLKTRKDDMGDYTIFKTLNEVIVGFRNVTGNIGMNIYLEDRDGVMSSAKSFTISGPSSQITAAWGNDRWGTTGWGESENSVSSYSEETIKRALLYKTARYLQYEITTSGRNDNYELLGLKARAIPQGTGSVPSTWNVE
jgi:hypothetical protein